MLTILVVDDDPGVRESVADVLGLAFAEHVAAEVVRFVQAEDGEQALAISRRSAPALVIMDVHMPGLDGIETFSALCEQCGRTVPTIFLTGFASSGKVKARMERALEAGALACLSKPAPVDEIAALIERALPDLA